MSKQVFSSNSQLAHVWAQQTQDTGRANNTFFQGRSIYSYGHHYVSGMIHKAKSGKAFALINSTRYSNSTCKHTGLAWRATYKLMPTFYVFKPVRSAQSDPGP